jgi:hypothetical protein
MAFGWDDIKDFFTDTGTGIDKLDWSRILGTAGGAALLYGLTNKDSKVGEFLGLGGGNQQPVGYQGKIPEMTGIRAAIPRIYDANLRPGSAGQRYFSDMNYATTPADVTAKQAAAETQASGLSSLNIGNPVRQMRPQLQRSPAEILANYKYIMDDPGRALWTEAQRRSEVQGVMDREGVSPLMLSQAIGMPVENVQQYGRSVKGLTPPVPSTPTAGAGISKTLEDLLAAANKPKAYGTGVPPVKGMATGGLTSMQQGMYLGGATDGMADELPATINGEQEAALSDGEFVVPADVVSHLGNGNSDAGAQVLYAMMDRVRQARTGNVEQGKRINPGKMLPK